MSPKILNVPGLDRTPCIHAMEYGQQQMDRMQMKGVLAGQTKGSSCDKSQTY